MLYNLNFIETPDWEREGAIDPKFLAVVAGALLVLAALAFVSARFVSLQQARQQNSRLQRQKEELRSGAEEVRRQQACLERWQDILDELRRKADVRLVFSRQLHAVQSLVPDAITLEKLSVKCRQIEIIEEAPAASAKRSRRPRRPKRIPMIECEMTLRGVARGTDAMQN